MLLDNDTMHNSLLEIFTHSSVTNYEKAKYTKSQLSVKLKPAHVHIISSAFTQLLGYMYLLNLNYAIFNEHKS